MTSQLMLDCAIYSLLFSQKVPAVQMQLNSFSADINKVLFITKCYNVIS